MLPGAAGREWRGRIANRVGLGRVITTGFFLAHTGAMVEDAGSFIFNSETNLSIDWLRPVACPAISNPNSVDPGCGFLY
jgi:hypothetical protein